MTSTPNPRFSVAPMLDWTDRHCRYFYRRMTRHALLYTEMVTTGALIHGGNPERFLGHEDDMPVVLQLGGSAPDELAQCARMGESWGYQAINLNVGCPSDRVQNNMIGACLMAHPRLVAEGVHAMKGAVSIPVTVKTRIGIDEMESYQAFEDFCAAQIEAGCDGLIVHARKAWLQGLSPKENREIPPLRHEWVYRLKKAFPDTEIVLNGGIQTLDEADEKLRPQKVGDPPLDGVMLGRAVYENPWMLANVDRRFYGGENPIQGRFAVVEVMRDYTERHIAQGGRLHHVIRHMLGLFKGYPGGRKWRQILSQQGHRADAGWSVVETALEAVRAEIRRAEERDRAVS
ncbi:tRNA-U16,U17-dihydrouridine synthase [Sulfurivirga caldicuralii]|uniref:tRNA-dihydrouridine(20/20a) synthase n=1 Tax=Sulfurivirga caldicuralii TaxID=364032 RepID=A0A1N6FA66_9GAMM|nr:tRNA dihydrouridine(20/20a) synthase DusA [Sulfurivirga caldicuralii]SIN92178.1 tRNA-U16,U17-dihydrouridine synthase [Sulfurivirga caldicuralii]